MKYSILHTAVLLLFFSVSASAQTLEMSRGQVSYEDKIRQTIKVSIQPESKEVKRAWKKFIQKTYDADVDGFGLITNKEILTAKDANINTISNKSMDLFAQIEENGSQTEMHVFGALGYDLFLNPQNYSKEFWGMEDLVIDFLVHFLPDHIQDNVDEVAKTLADLKDDRADLKKDIQDRKGKIESLKKEITENEEEIKQLNKNLISNEKSVNKTAIDLRVKKRKLDRVQEELGVIDNN